MSRIQDQMRRAVARTSLTRYRLSKQTGISEASLCRLASGQRGLSIRALETLADILGMEWRLVPKMARRKKGGTR